MSRCIPAGAEARPSCSPLSGISHPPQVPAFWVGMPAHQETQVPPSQVEVTSPVLEAKVLPTTPAGGWPSPKQVQSGVRIASMDNNGLLPVARSKGMVTS